MSQVCLREDIVKREVKLFHLELERNGPDYMSECRDLIRKVAQQQFGNTQGDYQKQIDYLVSQYNTTKDKALSDLNNVGPVLGTRVQEQLGKEVRPALDAALTMAGEVLQEGTERLHANLTDVKMHLSNTLNDSACNAAQAASTCNIIRNSLNQLNINANFSGLPGVSSQLAKINDVLKIDLSSLVQKGYAAFNDTPDLVVNQTRNILSDIKTVLESIGSNITTFTKALPVQKILADLMIYLTQSEAYVQDYFPVVEQYDFYRWLGCLILCCMVVLILVFYYLGLLCGTCGYDKHASPTTRGCISNTGGNFLMADCKENKGIYTSLHLEYLFNINEFLNISMYTEDVALKIEHIQINLSKIILLDEIGKENLLNFSSSGIDGIDFSAYLTEINKSVTKVDLLSFANDLEARADQLPKGALENALKGHANNIRMIHNQQVVPLEQAMSTLNQSIRLLKRTSSELMVKVKNVISAVNAAQSLINNNASQVIVQETKKYMDTIVGYFEQYTEWVKESIAMEVAACKPIANVIDTAVDIFLCSYITDSVNTFWFGLGGSSMFLIPAIIFAVKLSKYYRRMDTEDVYDDSSMKIAIKQLENGKYPLKIKYDMFILDRNVLLSYTTIVVICGVGALGQKLKPKKRSNGEEIKFRTKTKDVCTMSISGDDDETKLRIECKNQGMSYWCEFTGKPSVCRAFRNNPKIYWNQVAAELRKIPHACESTEVLKTTMCQKAPPEALMKQIAAGVEPEDVETQEKSIQKTSIRGAGQGPENETEAMKLAREHCWESLHGFCSYIIGIFRG
ncbi:prominin-1 isoform X13 [Willisornis vidua]|uniref:Prominin-1 isoform X13 n=1 Tax=Willisornis vidua TaxID=1566151 RepID=A0ABQ9CWI5_9PASS|nr:prominin-1 isoform X13 [Willisornis vidua]